jgi:hypothetical protein
VEAAVAGPGGDRAQYDARQIRPDRTRNDLARSSEGR